MLFVVLSFVIMVIAEFAAWRVYASRILRHNISHALTPIMLELDRINSGRVDDATKAQMMIKAMRGWIHPQGKAEIGLRDYLKPLISSYRWVEFYADCNPVVYVDLGALHSIAVNAMANAMEARLTAIAAMKPEDRDMVSPVRIHLAEEHIKISNPALEADMAQVLSPDPGSTRGEGRGSGKKSIADSCRRIGWAVDWAVSGRRVITTLRFAC
jgi:hypothetical protein